MPAAPVSPMAAVGSPLELLPAEIVLHIIDFVSLSSVVRLAQTSKSWHHFIDKLHVDRIYGHPSKFAKPRGYAGLNDIDKFFCFTNYFANLDNWKEWCKRSILLRNNWDADAPLTQESFFHVQNQRIWQFWPDFRRRFFVTISRSGIINIIHMDTGQILSSHKSNRDSRITYNPGLGIASWPTADGEQLGFWKALSENGCFECFQVYRFPEPPSSYDISSSTLYVLTRERTGLVYDLRASINTPHMRMKFAAPASGFIVQSEDLVFHAVFHHGFHAYHKSTGRSAGTIQPNLCTSFYHIKYKRSDHNQYDNERESLPCEVQLQRPTKNQIRLARIEPGLHPDQETSSVDDDWGPAVIKGVMMAAISRRGRLFVAHDWPSLLNGNQEMYDKNCILIECGADVYAGPCITFANNRVAVNVGSSIFVVSFQNARCPNTAWQIDSTLSSSSQMLVSWIGIFYDALMYTYERTCDKPEHGPEDESDTVCGLRVLTFAPNYVD